MSSSSSSNDEDVIGEGTYGCVHKPSLHCDDPTFNDFDYDDYVSKIMLKKHAEKEMNEFVTIGKYDTEAKYYSGKPKMCVPKVSKSIRKCRHIDYNNVVDSPENYRLLLLKYGGPDLSQFCKNHLPEYLQSHSPTDFWKSAHNLVKGLHFFKTNGLVHNDIKPQNVVFNYKTGVLKYIDFGLMRTKEKIYRLSQNSENNLGSVHWNYPMECGFMNADDFQNYLITNKQKLYAHIMQSLTGEIPSQFPRIKRPDSFQLLFSYLDDELEPASAQQIQVYVKDFLNGVATLVYKDKLSYDDILNRIIDGIDIYSVGMTLQFVANSMFKLGAISNEYWQIVSIYCYRMWDFSLKTRTLDTETLVEEYGYMLRELEDLGISESASASATATATATANDVIDLTAVPSAVPSVALPQKKPASNNLLVAPPIVATQISSQNSLSPDLLRYAYADPALTATDAKRKGHATSHSSKRSKKRHKMSRSRTKSRSTRSKSKSKSKTMSMLESSPFRQNRELSSALNSIFA